MSKQKRSLFRGAATAVITPMKGGRIDFDAFEHLLEFQISRGIDALVIAGTTGEASTLADGEHMELLRFAAGTVAGRVPVIAGTGSNCTAHAIKMSRFAEECGCNGLLLVTPYYNRATERGLIEHYLAIANGTSLPALLYNVPSRTGVRLTMPVYRALADHPRILGVKDASGDAAAGAEVLAELGDHFDLYSGNDDITLPLLALGGAGVISVASNVIPAEIHALCATFDEGRYEEARALFLATMPLCKALFAEVNPIPVKSALAMMGFCEEEYRLPLCVPAEETKKRLRTELGKLGLL